MSEAVRSPLLRRTFAACVVTLAVFTIVVRASEYGTVDRFSKDFALDYASAKAVTDGTDPYAPIQELVGRYLDPPPEVLAHHVLPGANWHPPFKVVVTLPFTVLPYQAAGVVWLLFSAACFAAAAFLFIRELSSHRRIALLCGAGIFLLPVVHTDLSAGQLNGPMLLGIVVAWRGLRRDRPLASGVALGVLVALKLFPGFLVLPLLGARRFRTVGFAAVVALGVTLAGGLVTGISPLEANVAALRGGGFSYWDASPANIAWWGVPTRWLTPNGWVAHLNLAPLGFTLAVAGTAVLVAAAFSRGRRSTAEDAFVTALPLMVLAGPISWDHYLILTLPWLALAVRQAAATQGRAPKAGMALLGMVLVLGIPPGVSPLDRVGAAEVAMLFQLPTAGLIAAAVLAAGGWMRSSPGRIESSPASTARSRRPAS